MRRIVAVAALALALPGVASASDATSAQVRTLAARASQDPAALAELRRIDRVDGVRMDLGRALQGGPGRSLEARLRVLAASSAGVAGAATPAREEARSILAQRRYRGSSVPRPLHGFLHWLGQKFAFVGHAFDWLAGLIPGGDATLWTILGALLVVGAAVVVSRLARRRAGAQIARVEARGQAAVDPAELERLAVEAEGRGELETAIRLRFRAGLLRLARARAIPRQDSITTREVRRTLRLPEFDSLAADFDEIVYGRRHPLERDVESARRDWPQVLAKAGSR
ncbi:MAG: hypothetical protein QOE95_972 [Gaiellaceae bacterium]|nr:hypothetical protein [Gaiellaceae bacterium]